MALSENDILANQRDIPEDAPFAEAQKQSVLSKSPAYVTDEDGNNPVPLEKHIKLQRLQSEEDAQRLARLMKERGKDAFTPEKWQRQMDMLKAWRAENPAPSKSSVPAVDPRIATDPVPTGYEEIDKEGQTVTKGAGLGMVIEKKVPKLKDVPFDDPVRIRADYAAQGVDFNKGLPFIQRLKAATSSNIPEARAHRLQYLQAGFKDVPDDLPKFRYVPELGEFHFLRPDEKNPGKYRWTSMDGSGLELGDLGDLFNLGEIGSMIGTVVGAGKGKVFTFGKLSPGKQAAIGGFGGANLGRLGGEAASIVLQYMTDGYVPTLKQLEDVGIAGLKLEAFASMTGELGAKILRSAHGRIDNAMAKSRGYQPVDLPAEDIAKYNANIAQTKADMIRMRDVLGRTDYPVTRGQSTHSISVIEEEAFALKNASKKTQREFNKADAHQKRAVQDYTDAVFGGNQQFLGDRAGVVVAANDAIGSTGKITIAQTEDGLVHVAPKVNPEKGLKIEPGSQHWQIREAGLDDKFLNTGIGRSMYDAAALEAQSYGKVLVSDVDLTPDAMRLWKSLDGSENFGKLEWNRDVTEIKDAVTGEVMKIVSNNGEPVVRMVKPSAVTPQLLERYRKPQQNATGRMEKDKEFSRFLRRPGRRELGQVVDEISSNPFIKQDLREAIFDDYVRNVNVDGKYSVKAFEQWKDETGRVLEEVFTPEEMVRIRTSPRGLRDVVDANRTLNEGRLNNLSRTMNVPRDSLMFKDPTVKGIWDQFQNIDTKARQRTMRVLDAMGMGDGIRGLMKEDIRLDLHKKIRSHDSAGYDVWLKDNKEIIKDVLGDTKGYIDHLNTIGNILKRRSDRAMVKGTGADANPTGLALTRVIFGPLSRAQRFFSAGRRGVVRSGAATTADIITDPDKLLMLEKVKHYPVESRVVAKMLQETGLIDQVWWSSENFDADNPDHRRQVAKYVMSQLQEELSQ